MVEETKFCGNCGATLSEGARFCNTCGASTDGEAAPAKRGGIPRSALIGGGAVLGLALLGGLGYALSGKIGLGGAGGADRNGDGKISIQEFGTELRDMKHPKQGRWKMSFEATQGDSMARFGGETALCGDANFWQNFDQGLAELTKPENTAKIEEELQKFQRDYDGKFQIDRFDVDGDNFDLKFSASGASKNPPVTGKGAGSIALKGTVAETKVDLSGDADYDIDFKGSEQGSSFEFQAKTKGRMTFKAERVGECPPAPPPSAYPMAPNPYEEPAMEFGE